MGALKVGKMVLGMVETNCYFIYDPEKMEAVVIDPAKDGLYEKLAEHDIRVCGILLTHGHFDHIMGVRSLSEKSGAKVYALKAEDELCRNSYLNSSDQIRRPYTVEPDILLSDQDEIEISGMKFKVYATPGHTIGSCCYYVESEKWLFSGDTLFRGSIGRSDLPTGSGEDIMDSVQKLVEIFDGDVKVYPGHGDSTTIEFEKNNNPYVRIS
ncbi:MAG: MBL fold metallo-hydrolase [Lachnospiraceae bacterium]|nr:MBL fold metallo-hydrolase [Lachnospiraceae bacterium]